MRVLELGRHLDEGADLHSEADQADRERELRQPETDEDGEAADGHRRACMAAVAAAAIVGADAAGVDLGAALAHVRIGVRAIRNPPEGAAARAVAADLHGHDGVSMIVLGIDLFNCWFHLFRPLNFLLLRAAFLNLLQLR